MFHVKHLKGAAYREEEKGEAWCAMFHVKHPKGRGVSQKRGVRRGVFHVKRPKGEGVPQKGGKA